MAHEKVRMSRTYTEHGETLEAGTVHKVTAGMARHLRQMGYAVRAPKNASFEDTPEAFTETTADRLAADAGTTVDDAVHHQAPESTGSGTTPKATAAAKSSRTNK